MKCRSWKDKIEEGEDLFANTLHFSYYFDTWRPKTQKMYVLSCSLTLPHGNQTEF